MILPQKVSFQHSSSSVSCLLFLKLLIFSPNLSLLVILTCLNCDFVVDLSHS